MGAGWHLPRLLLAHPPHPLTFLPTLPSLSSPQVYRALCKPYDEVVAVKLLDLETVNASLDEIVREAATMRSQSHPNILPLHCSFVHGQVRERVCVCVEE